MTSHRFKVGCLALAMAVFAPLLAWGQGKPAGRPEVRSASAVVIAADDNSVLYAQDANQVMPVASITKLMTALVVLESGADLDELITIDAEDRRSTQGNASRLAVGAQLTRAELLLLALMSSENRAAQALARVYPGGVTAFMAAMNAKARALGMRHTSFADPTGLSPHNVSTAADLVQLVLAAAEQPLIQDYSTRTEHQVTAARQVLGFRNTNLLVDQPDWSIQVQKTGFTLAAGQCLVMQATIDGRPVVMVLLNSFGKYTRVADARRIRRWMESTGVHLIHAGAPVQLGGGLGAAN